MTHKQCPECSEALVCPGHGAVQRPLVAACPSKRGGVWVSVRDAAGHEVPGVPVEVDGQQVATDATGLAAFDPLDDGSYSARLGVLPCSVATRFDPPAQAVVEGISVSRGKISLAELVLRRRPTLKVELSRPVAATVTITHGDGDSQRKTTKDGTADFGAVRPGAYAVDVELEADAEAPARRPSQRLEVEVDHDEDEIVPVHLQQRVDPVIEHDRDALAVGGERLTVTLRASGPFEGGGRLTITAGEASIRVLRNDQVQPLTNGTLAFQTLDDEGIQIQLEAVRASAFEGVGLQWELIGDDVGPAAATNLTAVEATLVIHDLHDAPLARERARTDGRVLAMCQAPGRRAKVTVRCEPAEYEGEMLLTDRNSGRCLRLHEDATSNEVLPLPYRLALPLEEPVELYVEGIQPSPAAGDDALELDIRDLGEGVDHVVLTVVQATLELCGPRPAGGEPEPLDETEKLDPGRELLVQGWDFASPRARVRVLKQPADAPCTLRLDAPGAEIRLFSAKCERHEDGEAPEILSRLIEPDEITDAAAGLTLWAEGAAETPDGTRTTLRLDIVDAVEGCDEIGFTVGLATVEVAVERRDGAQLSAPVEVELRSKPGEAVLFHRALTPEDGKVELRVPPASYAIGIVAGAASPEAALRILRAPLPAKAEVPDEATDAGAPPDPTAAPPAPGRKESAKAAAETEARAASVRIQPGDPTSIRYTLAPAYDRIQLIAYQIRTGDYLGTDDADALGSEEAAVTHDITKRCDIMKAAMAHARSSTEIETEPTTLKVFMAPEFYFRGRNGAYPVESLHRVPDQMRQETDKPEYADWMFVFGSAIGRMEHSERTELAGTEVGAPISFAVFSYRCAKTSSIAKVQKDWTARLSQTKVPTSPSTWKGKVYGTATISHVVVEEESAKIVRVTVTCVGVPAFPSKGFTLAVRAPTPKAKFRSVPKPKLEKSASALSLRCTELPQLGWMIRQGTLEGDVYYGDTQAGDHRYIEFNRPSDILPQGGVDVELVDPREAEIFNVAFVQQGGAATSIRADGSRELDELLVYKETISSIDFKGDDYSDHAFYQSPRHRAKLDGDQHTRLLPTAGSTDVAGSHPNWPDHPRTKMDGTPTTVRTTEVTEHGLGGGSVFTMHGITFGLEVCLDHSQRRLAEYYDEHAIAGEPEVQVHLIPSCGMSIENPCCVDDGLVFNVDAGHQMAWCYGEPDALEPKWQDAAPMPTGISRADYFSSDGEISVYEPQPTPTAAVVT
ncbi:MAG: carboxypeptidase regulatory-like domain-containing protein [Myxococcales bacterium]|nr:carboxypeptidase regulatory-like domain-containing protein [Myxococcales bacterium]MCB9715232.1 carboxypeptidase regulatory-like domain-containing protein [Myxococcales bacterium]